MKNFIAIENKRIRKGLYNFQIYRVKNNKLHYICDGIIAYGLTRGPHAEVMKCLIEEKQIPKQKDYYYEAIDNKKFNIEYYSMTY